MHFLEWLLHLPHGFLSRGVRLRFDPHWPGQAWIDRVIGQGGQTGWGAGVWNLLLIAAALWLVVWVYRREAGGKAARGWRIAGGILRGALLLGIIALLNNPLIEQPRERIEPSVLAVLVDDSLSMSVKDAGTAAHPLSRLAAVQGLLDGGNQPLLKELEQRHEVKLYAFDQGVKGLGIRDRGLGIGGKGASSLNPDPSSLTPLSPTGASTHLTDALRSVLSDLQGRRLAGVVLFSDGRQTPAPPEAAQIEALKSFGVKIFPVAVGTQQTPRNIVVESLEVEEAAFVGDIVNVKAAVSAQGYPHPPPVRFELLDRATGLPLRAPDGNPARKTLALPPAAGGGGQSVELQFKPDQPGPLDVELKALPLPGELDDADNARSARVQVLAATINVLYVEGYPRWDYRYLKTQMVRDKTVNISCLLLSADSDFAQEGDPPAEGFPGPVTRFPESLEELLKYDVVLIGDVDPRQFTDTQLQLLSDFVSRKGGGFEMIAGPQASPQAWRGTPVEAMLPVRIGVRDEGLGIREQGAEPKPLNPNPSSLTPSSDPNPSSLNPSQSFRPVLTPAGKESGLFRFFADPAVNQRYIEKTLPALFWYCRGGAATGGVGQVLA
jgi:hypothetical protein